MSWHRRRGKQKRIFTTRDLREYGRVPSGTIYDSVDSKYLSHQKGGNLKIQKPIRIRCPFCNKTLRISNLKTGTTFINCPTCKKKFGIRKK